MRHALIFVLLLPATAIAQNAAVPLTSSSPEAESHFREMQEAFKEAKTLSFVSHFDVEVLGVARSACTYRVWLKKPNRFRIESESAAGKTAGVMIGDGTNLWIYWPNGRPVFENVDKLEPDEVMRLTSYVMKPATHADRISIAHEAPLLGGGMGFPIVDPSVFHGHVDSLAAKIDGFRNMGHEAIDGHDCVKVEVSILDRQRSQYLWLSQEDYIPRRLVELARLHNDVVTRERWSSVQVNKQISDDLFRWEPPVGWQRWKLPDDERNWPRIGSKAPNFTMTSVDGENVTLSDFRGKAVWIIFWRLGCPPCIEELPQLQDMHTRFANSGLKLIGVNVSDDRKLINKLLDTMGITFLNLHDTSPAAQKVYDEEFGVGAIPMNCVLDADGTVVDVWVGYSEERVLRNLCSLGINVEP